MRGRTNWTDAEDDLTDSAEMWVEKEGIELKEGEVHDRKLNSG